MHAPVAPDRPAVTFREVRKEDLPVIFALRRDVVLQSFLLTVPDALDDAALHAWLERRQRDPGGLFRVVEDARGDVIGYAQISRVQRRNRSGYPGIALAEHARGRGLGQATYRKLIRAARDELGLIKLLSEVRVDNFAAMRYNILVGFRMIGTLRDDYTDGDGRRYDVLLFELMLDEADV